MELQFKGANCLRIITKNAVTVVDDNLASLGLKSQSKVDVRLYSHQMLKSDKAVDDAFMIDGPGEYEIKGVSVIGIPARAHMDEAGVPHTAAIYKIIASGISMAVIGHIYPELSDDELEAIGLVDIVVIPVGGAGYTLDAVAAAKIVKKIGPKVVIPTHYADKGVKYEVPQSELADFLKEVGTEPIIEDRIKLKAAPFNELLEVYQLNRS